MSVTDDYRALRGAWEQETQVGPCLGLERLVAEARQRHLDAEEMGERMRFSAWLNTLRALVDRQQEAIDSATAMWLDSLRGRGILGPKEVTE